jgi:hypothetical protein
MEDKITKEIYDEEQGRIIDVEDTEVKSTDIDRDPNNLEESGKETNDLDAGNQDSDDNNPKQPTKFEKKINKLHRQKKEAEERANYYKQQLAEYNKQSSVKKPELKRSDFNSESDYIDYVTDQKVNGALTNQQVQQMEYQRNLAENQARTAKWQSTVANYSNELPDFVEVVGSSDAALSGDTQEAIIESDVGPKVAYYLAKNPNEVQKLNTLSGRAFDRYFIRLENKVESMKFNENNSQTSINTPPSSQARMQGSGGSPKPMNQLSMDEWIKRRNEQASKRY